MNYRNSEATSFEVMRQPLEDGNITASCALRSLNYTVAVILVAAMNLVPADFSRTPKGK
jgi:predicted ATPase with chaperone activity